MLDDCRSIINIHRLVCVYYTLVIFRVVVYIFTNKSKLYDRHGVTHRENSKEQLRGEATTPKSHKTSHNLAKLPRERNHREKRQIYKHAPKVIYLKILRVLTRCAVVVAAVVAAIKARRNSLFWLIHESRYGVCTVMIHAH